jgi:hypothetical protein
MILVEHLFADLDRLPEERLGLGIFALVPKQ